MDEATSENQAYSEGYDAGLKGRSLNDNPYTAGTAEHTAWSDGHAAAGLDEEP